MQRELNPKKTEDMKNTEAEIVKSESIKKQDSQKIESAKKSRTNKNG